WWMDHGANHPRNHPWRTARWTRTRPDHALARLCGADERRRGGNRGLFEKLTAGQQQGAGPVRADGEADIVRDEGCPTGRKIAFVDSKRRPERSGRLSLKPVNCRSISELAYVGGAIERTLFGAPLGRSLTVQRAEILLDRNSGEALDAIGGDVGEVDAVDRRSRSRRDRAKNDSGNECELGHVRFLLAG